jgi:hypothetical protein
MHQVRISPSRGIALPLISPRPKHRQKVRPTSSWSEHTQILSCGGKLLDRAIASIGYIKVAVTIEHHPERLIASGAGEYTQVGPGGGKLLDSVAVDV